MNIRKKNSSIVLLFLLLFNSCNTLNKGFDVQVFKPSNSQFEDLIKTISDDVAQHNKDGYTSVLELNRYDSVPEFWFSYQLNENINNYIFNNNKRIIGYLNYNKIDFILLSNINNKSDFEMFFYKFVSPAKENKRIRHLFYPPNQYASDEAGKPLPPIARDQGYVVYAFINDSLKNVTSDSWIYERVFR